MLPRIRTGTLGVVLLGVCLGLGTASLGFAYHSYLLTVQELRSGLQQAASPSHKGFTLVDVRTAEEHAGGIIPGTDFNIDYREMKNRHKEIGASVEDHIVVYCQSGKRSNIAAETLADLGYKHVYNVAGSVNAWLESGFPLEPAQR